MVGGMNLASIEFSESEILEKNRRIRERVLSQSREMSGENFSRVSGTDLKALFDEIDREYFNGELGKLERSKSSKEMLFRLSSRATRSGGTTFRHVRKGGVMSGFWRQVWFEISISQRLLFLNFEGDGRAITVGGRPCSSRLEAMQRIMEHEMMHLWELLLYGKSSCRASRFKTLIQRIFGHTESAHRLITPTEKAIETHQIRIGQTVEFVFNRKPFSGMVNRINHRATVLVESHRGQLYRDGKKYEKFYVPLGKLKPKP